MKLYESQLEGIVTTAKAVKKEVEDSASDKKISGGNEDKHTKAVSESTTMAELSKRITIGDKALMSFNTSLERSRRIRERNHFGTQVANVKKWLAEADEMEAEAGPG